MKKEIINSKDAPEALGPYSQAVKIGDFLYASGQIPINPTTGEMVNGNITEATTQVLRNVTAVLAEAQLTLNDIVKVTVFLSDMNDFAGMNEVYGEFFKGTQFPARSTIQIARLPKDALVEIEITAVNQK